VAPALVIDPALAGERLFLIASRVHGNPQDLRHFDKSTEAHCAWKEVVRTIHFIVGVCRCFRRYRAERSDGPIAAV
jgi:hypothetical protein